jgi:cell volume regulation protein A
MQITLEHFLLVTSILLLISVLAGRTSYKYGVPTLLLFIAIGMLAGSEGIGKIYFDNPQIAQFIGVVSLNFILFSGGLDTNWTSIKPILRKGISLSTVGVFLTAGIVGIFVWAITDFTIYESLLLGSIVSSTDAAAVFSILRSKNIALKNHLRPTLELESGSNDPMAYVLMLSFLGLVVNQDQELISLIPLFLKQMLIGAVIGIALGRISKWMINNIKLGFEGLYPVLVITLMLLTYSLTQVLSGNGFLAVYLAAVYIGNQDFIHKKTILKVFDGLAWLMQIILFLTLGLLVFPSQIVPVIGIGLLISLFLIFVARPISVFISMSTFKMSFKEKTFISWVGLRGAVPIVFATYPLLAGIDKAPLIFNIVFFISVTSVLIQGTTLSTLAKWLNLELPEGEKKSYPLDDFLSEPKGAFLEEFLINPEHTAVGKKIVELHFPKNAIIAMIQRDDQYFTPNGLTKIEINDKLFILSGSKEVMNEVVSCFTKDVKS